MVAEVIYKGPVPPAGEKYCFVCAFQWKLAVNERHQDEITAAGEAADGTIVVIDALADDIPYPALAVATGLNGSVMQFGVLDLCWSHVTAIQLKTASGIHLPPPGGGMPGMPGLPPGMGMNGR